MRSFADHHRIRLTANLLPIPVDREGLDPGRIPHRARIAFVTPAHQFPTGVTLPLARRLALLQWACRRNATVVEDDYGGEFRYEGQPLESLQGLDRAARVIFTGTFSRTVFPALRIGYLVSPKSLVPAFTAAKWLCDRQTPSLEQKALAEFISSGTYERHLLRSRRRNAARRAALLGAIGKYLGDRVEVTGAGTHVVVWPRDRLAEDEIITAAAARGVAVYGVSTYRLKRSLPPRHPAWVFAADGTADHGRYPAARPWDDLRRPREVKLRCEKRYIGFNGRPHVVCDCDHSVTDQLHCTWPVLPPGAAWY